MAKRKILKKTLDHRKSLLIPEFVDLGIDQKHLGVVLRRANVEKSIARLRMMKKLGVPMKGLSSKLSISDADFKKFVARYSSKFHLNKGQKKLFKFMRDQGISERVAGKITSNTNYARMSIPQKIDFFNSFELDPNKYGVDRIPVSYYEHLLGEELKRLQIGIKRKVLFPLEDRFASEILDNVLSGWRDIKTLNSKKIRIRPSKILRRIKELIELGIEPRTDYIVGSLEHAKQVAVRRRTNMSKVVKIREKNKSKKVALKDSRKKELKQIEDKIKDINDKIAGLTPARSIVISRNVISDISIRVLKKSRYQLIRQRDTLL
jgi:hemerythrin-like domain-containing protein